MRRSTLLFSLEYLEKELHRDSTRMKAWASQVLDAVTPLVAKVYRFPIPDFLIDLDSPKLPDLVATIDRLRRQKVARPGSAHIEEWLEEDERMKLEWFVLSPTAEFDEWPEPQKKDFPALNRLEVPTTKADAYKAGVHVAGGRGFVSESFKELVEREGLAGVEFIWVPDIGKYEAPQWYLPVAAESLGRGLDHPWFDPSKFITSNWPDGRADQPQEPEWRYGVAGWFSSDQFRPRAGYDDPIKDKLLSMFRKGQLHVESHRRALRKHLPDTDFAYVWVSPEQDRVRQLCVSRKARDLLIEARLVGQTECVGVEVLDRRYKGAELLDGLPGGPAGPGPAYSSEEIAAIREEEARAWADFAARAKPTRETDVKRSVKRATKRKKRKRVKFDGAASEEAIQEAGEELPVPIPPAWQHFLRTIGGAFIRKCVLTGGQADSAFAAPHELAPLQEQLEWLASEIDPDLAEGLLWVGETEFGDAVALDTSTVTKDGECRVVLMSHETMDVDREWNTVAEFLDEVLAEEDG